MEEKSLRNTNVEDVRRTTSDVVVVGDGDLWLLLSKASSEIQGWMKSCKAMQIEGVGCVVQTTSERRNPDGSWSVSDTQCFVPGVRVSDDVNGGRKLVKI